MIYLAILKKTQSQFMVINLLIQIFYRKCLVFVPNVYIVVEKNVHVYFNKINPEEVFQRNYASYVCYVSRHRKHSTLKTTNEELIDINS